MLATTAHATTTNLRPGALLVPSGGAGVLLDGAMLASLWPLQLRLDAWTPGEQEKVSQSDAPRPAVARRERPGRVSWEQLL